MNTKTRKNILVSHILGYFDDDMEAIKNQIVYIVDSSNKNLKIDDLSYQQLTNACKSMVYGGMFLVYNSDIKDFLDSLEYKSLNTDKLEQRGMLLEKYSNILTSCILKMIQ